MFNIGEYLKEQEAGICDDGVKVMPPNGSEPIS
jgi:hypothetical protein